jgi:hypothetical protein
VVRRVVVSVALDAIGGSSLVGRLRNELWSYE